MERERGRNTSFSFESCFKLTKTLPYPTSVNRHCKYRTHFANEQTGAKESSGSGTAEPPIQAYVFPTHGCLFREGDGKQEWEGSQRAGTHTSFRLEVGDAVHDHVVQKQGLVVHFDGAREQAAEVMHIPGAGTGAASAKEASTGAAPSHVLFSPRTLP